MKPLCRRARLALALALALVVGQVALAAYACQGIGHGAASHAGCGELAREDAAACEGSQLCWSHCQSIDQVREHGDPAVGAWAGACDVLRTPAVPPAPGGALAAARCAPAHAAPPAFVLYCRLLN